jgi:hypothetical protein
LRFLEDGLTNLIFGVAIDNPEFGLLLHFVRELIFRNVRRQKFESRVEAKNENYGEDNRFESSFAMLCTVADAPPISAGMQHYNASQWPTARADAACEK